MKKLCGLVVFLLLLVPALFAQEHYTEGPIWRVTLIRVKPTHMDDYLTMLRQTTKSVYEENRSRVPSSTTRSSSRRPRTAPRIGTSASPSSTRTTPP